MHSVFDCYSKTSSLSVRSYFVGMFQILSFIFRLLILLENAILIRNLFRALHLVTPYSSTGPIRRFLQASPIHSKFELDPAVQKDVVSLLVDWSGHDPESSRAVLFFFFSISYLFI